LEDIDLLIGQLRNSIHGEVLTSELRERVDPTGMTLTTDLPGKSVALESRLASTVVPAAQRCGGTDRWGIHQIYAEGAALIDPWRYCEAAIATTGEALSSVLSALAGTPAFDEIQLDAKTRALYLGRAVQRENAKLLFGVEDLPPPPKRS
jgi:hypothetical protein